MALIQRVSEALIQRGAILQRLSEALMLRVSEVFI